MAEKSKDQDWLDNQEAQEAVANITDVKLLDDSDKLKENRNMIDADTATNSPTKGIFATADEIVNEADFTPSEKKKQKIIKGAKSKLSKQSGIAEDRLEEILNYTPAEEPFDPNAEDAPVKSDLELAAEARKGRADAWDKYGPDSPEYRQAKNLENFRMDRIERQGMSIEEAEKILQGYQSRVAAYDKSDAAKNEYFEHLKKQYTSQLNKIIEDDTLSWTERKKKFAKAGLIYGNILQNIGAMLHNIANPNDWITANDAITMRMGQNLANTVKNRQSNNDKYIQAQADYWSGILPVYVDASKLKQKLGNAKLLNTYQRLDTANQKMVAALSTSDAWDTVSGNALLTFMDRLQSGEYTTATQIAAGAVSAMMTSGQGTVDSIVDKLKGFLDMIGIDPADLKKLVKSGGKTLSGTVGAIANTADKVNKVVDNYKKTPKIQVNRGSSSRKAKKPAATGSW